MGRKGFFGPCGGELDMVKPSFFKLDARANWTWRSRPSSLDARANWLWRSRPSSAGTHATLRLASSLVHSLRHGFRQIWSKGLMPSEPLTGKGESGASAETVQTMWYGMWRPLSTGAPVETYIVPTSKVCLFLRLQKISFRKISSSRSLQSVDGGLFSLFYYYE